MSDIWLWQQLQEDPIDPQKLIPLLQEISKQPLPQRLPFLGWLLGCIEHPDPELQATAYRMFAGSTGYAAWKLMLRGLLSQTLEVRQAALDALQASAVYEPERWNHLLFHGQAEIRQWAVEHPPASFPQHSLLSLLPDAATRWQVRRKLHDITLQPEQLPLLLDYVEQHQVGLVQAMRWLSRIGWDRHPEKYFTALGVARQVKEWPTTPESAEELFTHPFFPEDPMDRWQELLWMSLESGVTPLPEQSRNIWDALHHRWCRGYLHPDVLYRVCASIARVGFREWSWDPAPLALCARAMPCLLAHLHIPLDIRRAAVQRMGLSQQHLELQNQFAALLQSDLCRQPNGLLNLKTLAGLLTLLPGSPYKTLLEHLSPEVIQESLWSDPLAACEFLAQPPQGRKERTIHHQWLRSLVLPQRHPDPAIIAQLTLRLPVDRLSFLQWLTDWSLPQLREFCRCLMKITDPGQYAYSEQKFDRIAQPLVALFLPQKLGVFLECLTLYQPSSEDAVGADGQRLFNPLSLACLGYVGRQVKTDILVKAILALPLTQIQTFLLLEQQCLHFPYEQEQALLKTLAQHEHPSIRQWTKQVQSATHAASVSSSLASHQRRQGNGEPLKLTADQKRKIATGSDLDMLDTLASLIPQPLLGLCDSLQQRVHPQPHPTCGVALLTCADPVESITSVFSQWSRDDSDFLHHLDLQMTSICEGLADLPILTNLWLYRWDRHHDQWIAQMLANYANLQDVSSWVLGLEAPLLVLRGWQALRSWIGRWRWHHRTKLKELWPESWNMWLGDLLVAPHLRQIHQHNPVPAWAHQYVERLVQEEVAHILVLIQELSWYPQTMETLRQWILPSLPQLLPSVQEILKSWLCSDTTSLRQKRVQVSLAKVPPALLQSIRKNFIPHHLAEYCRDSRRAVVEEAATQLVTLGQEGIFVLCEIMLEHPAPVHLRSLTATIPLWEDHPDARGCLADALLRTDLSEEHRYHIAVGLCEAGDRQHWPYVVEILHQPVMEDWFVAEDWLPLQRIVPEQRQLALSLLHSPQFSVYSRCLQILLAPPKLWDQTLQQAFVSFLQCGDSRLPLYRLRVARHLHQHGDWHGLPLLWQEALLKEESHSLSEPEFATSSLWAGVPENLVLAGIQSALYAGEQTVSLHRVLQSLMHRDVDETAKQGALLRILRTTHHAQIQQKTLEHLRPTQRRGTLLYQLAETFAWGILRGRELTGKMFRIDMIGGQEFGYTRLTEHRIFVNPLPLLREEQHGQQIVQGLILHELGHHVYHAAPESIRLWKQAQQEHLGSLLNLVSDEQLERSLRAKDRSYGNLLKRLAAYAFQHHEREIRLSELLVVLGVRAFAVLHRTPLRPSRRPGYVILSLGQLFFELEAQGSSFSRFVRALRMGLGDRHQDNKVQEALGLFGPKFRHSSMADMLAIARRLQQIFGQEVALLDMLRQDELWGSINNEAVIAISEGISSEEIQREVERILRGQAKREQDKSVGIRVINLRQDETFTPIHSVVAMNYNPTDYRPYQRQVLRWSAKMRDYFLRLGLGTVPERRRIRGYRLDVSTLPTALLRRDPRLLQSRKTVFQTDLFVGILIDCSGSMIVNDNIERAKLFAALLAEAAAPLAGLDARFFGFTDSHIYDAGNAQRCAIHTLKAEGGNNDAAALWHAAQIAVQSRRRAKLLIMISDGSPTECSVQALRSLVQRITRQMNISCAQVAVHPLDEICFPHYIEVTDSRLELAIHQFGQIVARLVRQTLQR